MTTATRRRGEGMDERIRARRREVRRARARKRRRVTVALLLLAGVVVGGVVVSRSALFEITDVEVDIADLAGAHDDRVAQVAAAAGISPGENLLHTDLSAAETRVEALPWVRTVEIGRVPPSTVRIAVTPRAPVATVNSEDSSWLVDAAGVVVAGGARDDLVHIDAVNSVLPGPGVRISDAAVRNALTVRAQLPESLREHVVRYDAPSPRGLRLLVRSEAAPDGVWVRFGLAERVDAKVAVLTALLEQAREHLTGDDEAAIAEFDVRAPDNPVLVPAGS